MGWSLEMLMSDELEASFSNVYKTTSSPTARFTNTPHTHTYLATLLPILFSENDKEIRSREELQEGNEE